MSDAPGRPDPTTAAVDAGGSLYTTMRQRLLTGVAITVPLVVTVYVLTVAVDFVVDALSPLVGVLEWAGVVEAVESAQLIELLVELGIYRHAIGLLSEFVALLVLLGVVAVVGTVGHSHYGERVIDYVDLFLASIPGVGVVYKSFRRMGDVMLDDGGENFQEVKLIQCFGDDVYVIGFKTSDAPTTIEDSTDHERMVSMFLPLAPNPVTGGLLTYVPRSKVYDVDMTIEEGVRSILTSGIATGQGVDERTELTAGNLTDVTDFETLQDAIRPGSDRES
jgi:uncharacterized membrane protein